MHGLHGVENVLPGNEHALFLKWPTCLFKHDILMCNHLIMAHNSCRCQKLPGMFVIDYLYVGNKHLSSISSPITCPGTWCWLPVGVWQWTKHVAISCIFHDAPITSSLIFVIVSVSVTGICSIHVIMHSYIVSCWWLVFDCCQCMSLTWLWMC